MTKKKSFDPFANLVLDDYEQEIEDAINRGEYVSDPNFSKNKRMLEEAAARHLELHNSKPVTIRIKQLDLIKVKARAKAKNIPYQTLLGSLIHQYAEGEKSLSL